MEDRFLFRGKRIDNGEWVEGNLIQSDDAAKGWEAIIIPTVNSNMFVRGVIELGFENWYRVDPSTICQCTGIKDKKGKLIWENDILEGHLDDKFPEDVTRTRVIWDKNGWVTSELGAVDREPLDNFDTENFEVVGTTFDNPELLEV